MYSHNADEKTPKKSIVETAARLIKSDIKTKVPEVSDVYPSTDEWTISYALKFLPDSLRTMLDLFVRATR